MVLSLGFGVAIKERYVNFHLLLSIRKGFSLYKEGIGHKFR